MQKPCLPRKRPIEPAGRAMCKWLAVLAMMACAAGLGACVTSSGSEVATSGTVGESAPAYSADGAVTAGSSANAFTPTGAAVHSAAASQAADVLTSVAKPGSSAYKIGPLDMLDVQVFKVPDLAKTV